MRPDESTNTPSLPVITHKNFRTGKWEYILGDDRILWDTGMFILTGLNTTDSGYLSLETADLQVHPDDRELARSIRTSIISQQHLEVDLRYTGPDEKVIWVHTWCEADFQAEGSVYKVKGWCRDITRIKEAEDTQAIERTVVDNGKRVADFLEEELERKNDMLQQAETTARLGSWKYNFVTRQIHLSDNAFALLGLPVQDCFEDPSLVFQTVHDE
ncbi:MAG: hypothetical protein EOP49_08230, partial [Sphingobacteriales bacterium]